MFTIEQIKAAHSKVKTGADFPNYIQDLIKLGVKKYETYVSDGHTIYYGANSFEIQSQARYSNLEVSDVSNKLQFEKELKDHQQGKSDYPTFCRSSADQGIEKWKVDLSKMTCTYYDKAENIVLEEKIPGGL